MRLKRTQIALGAIVLALGILPVSPDVHATEPPDSDTNSNTTGAPFAPAEGARASWPFQTVENLSLGAVTESSTGEESASELNRKLTNPVSDIWSISNQFNNFELNNGQWNNKLELPACDAS